jgi:hypothetical protein
MKDWEVVADNLKKAGWNLGWVSALAEGKESGAYGARTRNLRRDRAAL